MFFVVSYEDWLNLLYGGFVVIEYLVYFVILILFSMDFNFSYVGDFNWFLIVLILNFVLSCNDVCCFGGNELIENCKFIFISK